MNPAASQSSSPAPSDRDVQFREAVLGSMAQWLDTNYEAEIAAARTGQLQDPLSISHKSAVRRIMNSPRFMQALQDLTDPQKTREVLGLINDSVRRERDRDFWAAVVSAVEVRLLEYVREHKVASISADPALTTIEKYANNNGRNKFRSSLGAVLRRLAIPE